MTEEERRFKIKKKESYEEQIKKECKNLNVTTYLCGLSAATSVLMISATTQPNIDISTIAVDVGMAALTASLSAYHLKDLMLAISKKTMLESKIEDINTELEAPNNDENRGIRR